MSRALVTGSAGFVGRHMVEALENDGYTVDQCDIAHMFADEVYGDVRRAWDWTEDAGRATLTIRDVEPYDLVVHCAAVVGGIAWRTAGSGPLELACNDLAIDAAFFDWVRRAHPRHVVFMSSCAVYAPWPVYPNGRPVTAIRPYREDDIDHARPLRPDHTYGQVKLLGEQLAELIDPDRTHVHIVRPFSGHGADQDPSYPFPAILARAIAHQDPLTVWGSLDTIRDWVHIDDIVAAILTLVDEDITAPVNICTGRETTFRHLARMMADACGYQPDIVADTTKPALSSYRVGSPTRMLDYYQPTVTLEQSIERSVAARLEP